MGRLTNIKKETSTIVDKDLFAANRYLFTITDIQEVESSFSPNGQWKVTIICEDAPTQTTMFLGRGGSRDVLLLALQDAIAAEGPIEDCYLHGKKNNFGNTTWLLGEKGDADYKPF